MDVGLALPQFDFSVPGENPLQWSTVVAWANRAEALGFGSLWLGDHLFWDLARYGGPAEPSGVFDPVVGLAALARTTERCRLGTLVLCGPLRPPAVLAKALATVDVLSGGRLIVGIGAGWYEPELTAAGLVLERPGRRLDRLAEAVEVLKGTLAGGPFDFEGRFYGTTGARCLPRPAQEPRPPVWVGGKGGDRLLRLVAEHADGWNTAWVWSHSDYRARVAALDRACERAGRDPATVTRSVGLYALVGENEVDLVRRFERLASRSPPGVLARTTLAEWRRGRMVGTVDQVREQLAGWSAEGVGSLVLCSGAVPFSVTTEDDVETIAEACSLLSDAERRSY